MSSKNIYYFSPTLSPVPGDPIVDLRYAPKCGFTTSKVFFNEYWKYILGGSLAFDENIRKNFTYVDRGPVDFREQQWWNYGDILDPPFRKNSIRFAIKRDPVKRFLSGVDYLERHKKISGTDHSSIRSYPAEGFSSLEKVVSSLEQGKLMDWHLLTQTFFYGDKKQYDFVYDLTDINLAVKHIFDILKVPLFDENKKNALLKLHENKTPPTKNPFSLQVTDDIVERIKNLYRIDYQNGWY